MDYQIEYRSARINGEQVALKTNRRPKSGTYRTEYMVKVDTRWYRVNCFMGEYYILINNTVVTVEMGE